MANRAMLAKARRIVFVIEASGRLAMAADGPVPETQDVMSREQKRRLIMDAYWIAKELLGSSDAGEDLV